MPQYVHLKVKLKKQGEVEGESKIKTLERDKTIECIAYEGGVSIPYDVNSASPSGRRQYTPIKITKEIDQATPLFLNACASNEQIETAIFKFYRPAKTGDEELFFTVEIKGGYVTSSRQIVHDVMNQEYHHYKPIEEVTFTFQSITWKNLVGKKTEATDSWRNE
jgi:type VI secretion system secreted protein Hcp